MQTALASPRAAADWLAERVQGSLRTDSRAVQPGDAFIAWPGHAVDGRRFVPSALAAGAAACLVEREGLEAFGLEDDRVASLQGLKAASGAVADTYFGQPSARLDVVASTGTNGKTSTAWWVAQALTHLGRRCGVVETLGVGEPGRVTSTGLTTPDPVTLHHTLRGMVDQGFSACAIEASSIGLVEHRLDGARIAVALFTNFTRDHLDFHGSMDAYWQAKRSLFSWPGLRSAVVNIDDEHGAALAAELQGGALDLWTVSKQGPARLSASGVGYEQGGLAFDVAEGGQVCKVRTGLVGDYNASNLIVVMAALRALGLPLAEAAAAMAVLSPVPGRLQRVVGRDLELAVDYAHTPDALEKVLAALRPMARSRGGRLWCVFGCGGNRDASKRPLMGAIAERGADAVVLTSDNPRDEDPAAILSQILAGMERPQAVQVVPDRRLAIVQAVTQAQAGDIILLAGKGHEDTQEIAGVKRPFSDEAQARAALAQREGLAA